MQYSIITLLATTASLASATTTSVSTASPIGAVVPVGSNCDPKGTMCALGSQCYATNSMLQTVCGNFQASCTSDQQCAFNTCQNGFCAGLKASSASPSASQTPIGAVVPVGSNCDPKGTMCALGSQCYATNSMLQTVCGNFQASCTSDQQCAFNTCQNGFCAGFKASSSSASPTPTSSATSSASQTPIGAVVPVGSNCDPKGTMCALGAQCYAVNSMLQPVCGNFQASCTSDQQCAFNKCNGGFCNGFIASSSMASNGTATGSMKPTGTGSGSASKTSGLAEFTGAAVANVVPELMAVALGVAAWAL
ncbi:hypothetical protein B5807_02423 [Epicoccum nigrum]|jgi:hypothetical protein|uniref:Dickkopf N-terminal cysteine-rich domain-containing protein n=1 Tax=Epicoccum nigrum TaxID=105696 RepID=A0A1Y2M7Y0_EPING|nr:hypothetical protein B5807_02423 [Epicoccum nigrum]